MKNSKTDAVDAATLAEYAARMDFVAWTRPTDETIALRSFARRINALTGQKFASSTRLTFAPLALSVNIRSHPAALSASVCKLEFCSSVDTLA